MRFLGEAAKSFSYTRLTKVFLSWVEFAFHETYPRPVVTQLIDGIHLIRKSSKSVLLCRAKGGLGLKLFSGKRRSSIREYCWTADRLREKPTSITE